MSNQQRTAHKMLIIKAPLENVLADILLTQTVFLGPTRNKFKSRKKLFYRYRHDHIRCTITTQL